MKTKLNPKKVFFKVIKRILRGLGCDCYRSGDKRHMVLGDAFATQEKLVRAINKSDLCIFDVGANRGNTAARYLSRFPTATIYCFEAFPDLFSSLKTRFSSCENVEIIPKAITKSGGEVSFYVNENPATNSIFPRPSSERRYYPKNAGFKREIKVSSGSIDQMVEEKGVSHIDILKLDIQGGELEALLGAEGLLVRQGVSLIYSEVMFIAHYEGAPLYHEIAGYLETKGYSLYDICDVYKAKNGQLRFGNAIFISTEMRRKIVNQYPDEP